MEIKDSKLRDLLEDVVSHHMSVIKRGGSTLGQLHESYSFLNMVDNYMKRPEVRQDILPSLRQEVVRYVRADTEKPYERTQGRAAMMKYLSYLASIVFFATAMAERGSGNTSAALNDLLIGTLALFTGGAFEMVGRNLAEENIKPAAMHEVKQEDLATVLHAYELDLRKAMSKKA